jgi:hypothetical protein
MVRAGLGGGGDKGVLGVRVEGSAVAEDGGLGWGLRVDQGSSARGAGQVSRVQDCGQVLRRGCS